MSDSRPRVSLPTLAFRSELFAATRRYFSNRGYIEVDVPILSADRVIDPHLEPFTAIPAESPNGVQPRYLQTSVEFGMKRLLAAGATAIYQLCHVFRAGERGGRHNPEFTMVEWYRVGDTHHDQMDETERLLNSLAAVAGTPIARSFRRSTYQEVFLRTIGIDPLQATCHQLQELAIDRKIAIPNDMDPNDRDGWLNLILAFVIEPHLGVGIPEFVFNYPSSQAALARLSKTDPRVAERFELYFDGIELCNGYHELTDPLELAQRIETESRRRQRAGLPVLPASSHLHQAMLAGLPPCAGNALGFDRVLMTLTGAKTIDEVIPFAWESA